MRRLMTAAAVAALALAVGAGRANASSVEVFGDAGYWAIQFSAAPGEANRAAVTGDGGELMVRDDGATLSAGLRCARRDDHTAACSAPDPFSAINLDGGDGDDTLSTPSVPTRLDGGAGDDALNGGPGSDRLDGGPGIDTLHAGDGEDLITDRDAARPEADTFDGGPGIDTLDETARTTSLTIDLAAGATSEGDRLSGIESASGGFGADVITGDAGPNRLSGGEPPNPRHLRDGNDIIDGGDGGDAIDGSAGDDRLAGGPGDDLLLDGVGASTFDGGPGDDTIEAYSPAPDAIACGDGSDTVQVEYGVRPTGPDALASDCELLALTHFDSGPGLQVATIQAIPRIGTAGAASLRIACSGDRTPCRAVVAIGPAAQPFRPVARRRIRVARRATVRMALGAQVARRLRMAGRAEISVRTCSLCEPFVWTVPV